MEGKPPTTIQRPRDRCPACRSPQLKTLRSRRYGDGSKTQRKECRACKHKFDLTIL